MLQVAIEGHDRVAAGVFETGGDGGLVAEIATEGKESHPRIVGGHLSQQRQRTVARSVVHKNNLGVIMVGQTVQDFAKDAVEVRQHFLLLVNGRDDAN